MPCLLSIKDISKMTSESVLFYLKEIGNIQTSLPFPSFDKSIFIVL